MVLKNFDANAGFKNNAIFALVKLNFPTIELLCISRKTLGVHK